MYSSEASIESVAMQGLVAYVVVSFPFEFLGNIFMGYISAISVQDSCTTPSILCRCLISLPSSYLFTFYYKQGIRGLFYGCALGDFVLCIIFARLIATIDLDEQVKNIQEEKVLNEKERDSYFVITNSRNSFLATNNDERQSLLTIEDVDSENLNPEEDKLKSTISPNTSEEDK